MDGMNGKLTSAQFWKQFFEASANVSLSGYEEAALEEDVTHTEATSTDLDTPPNRDQYTRGGAQEEGDDDDDDDEFTVDSPTQMTGVQTTPKLPASTKKTNGKPPAAFRSPSPRKYTGKNPLAKQPSSEEPSTPRPQKDTFPQSSPFEPNSAFRPPPPSTRQNNDPLMHRVLDKNYRIQATPHPQRRQYQQAAAQATPATATKRTVPWDDSPQSSPATAAPQLRSDLFSPAKTAAAPRTPGIAILTPARKAGPATSTGRQLFSPQDKAYSAAKDRTSHIFFEIDDDDDSDDGLGDMSPPKTMQFHVPQSRLVQTPAREASKRIVEDLLLTAGADATDEIEGEEEEIDMTEPSPSVVRRGYDVDDDTF